MCNGAGVKGWFSFMTYYGKIGLYERGRQAA